MRLRRGGVRWDARDPRCHRASVQGPARRGNRARAPSRTRPGMEHLAPRAGVTRAPRRPHPGPVRRGDNQRVQPHPMRVLRRRIRGTVRRREFHRARDRHQGYPQHRGQA